MGAFFKSFWGQLGRSTGKRVSNALYGDKWATPYRLAVDKNKSRSKRSASYYENAPRKQSETSSTANRGTLKSGNRRWLLWIAGFILFAGTYNVILYPNKEDIVLMIMLWIVALGFLTFRYLSPRR